jgi:hypothetical protein
MKAKGVTGMFLSHPRCLQHRVLVEVILICFLGNKNVFSLYLLELAGHFVPSNINSFAVALCYFFFKEFWGGINTSLFKRQKKAHTRIE